MPHTYGIDIHGTLACRRPDKTVGPSTLYPLLSELMKVWMAKGDTVYILSGPPFQEIQKEVASLGLIKGVHYTFLISMVDHLRVTGATMWEDPPGSNHWWTDPADWNKAKGRLAKAHGIDTIIDDEVAYREAMPPTTTFILVTAELLKGAL